MASSLRSDAAAAAAESSASSAAAAAESLPAAAASSAAAAAESASAERIVIDDLLQVRLLHQWALEAHGGPPPARDLDFIEVFAGEAAVSKGLHAKGFVGATMDVRHDPRHNVLKPVGFLTLLALVMRLRPRGLLWLAPVCSTWVFMSRGTTGRLGLICASGAHAGDRGRAMRATRDSWSATVTS